MEKYLSEERCAHRLVRPADVIIKSIDHLLTIGGVATPRERHERTSSLLLLLLLLSRRISSRLR